jgi:hypothetical protein
VAAPMAHCAKMPDEIRIETHLAFVLRHNSGTNDFRIRELLWG